MRNWDGERSFNHLEHFDFDSSNSILDPLADLGMSVLTHRTIVFPGTEERRPGVDVSLVKNCVNSNSQEITECRHEGLTGIQIRLLVAVGSHS